MRFSWRFAAVIAAGVSLFFAAARILRAQSGPPSPSPVIPHVVPGVTGSRVKMDFYRFSWMEFYALNWPAKMGSGGLPERGAADTSKKMSDPGTRVWETWKADYELFPPQPKDKVVTPTPWRSWDVAVPVCDAAPGARLLPFIAKGESVIPGGVNQAMGGPLVDQKGRYVRYEVRMNQSEYEVTVSKEWFLRKNLSTDPGNPNLFRASTAEPEYYGAIELKGAWRVMTDQEKQANPRRYYMADVKVVDPKTGKCSGQTVTVGLVGFHIAHKTEPFKAWVWSTFEQIDNVPADGVPPPPLGYSLYDGKTTGTNLTNWGFLGINAFKPVDPAKLPPEPATVVNTIRLNPIQAEIKGLNDQVHQLPGIRGSVWEYYELVETQWQQDFPVPIKVSNPKTDEDLYKQLNGTPMDAVANTTMETFFQGFHGSPVDLSRNRIGIKQFGSSCLHCHYQSAQYDFSWMLADQAWPSSPASQGTTKSVAKRHVK